MSHLAIIAIAVAGFAAVAAFLVLCDRLIRAEGAGETQAAPKGEAL